VKYVAAACAVAALIAIALVVLLLVAEWSDFGESAVRRVGVARRVAVSALIVLPIVIALAVWRHGLPMH
jgi:hypothetical protein